MQPDQGVPFPENNQKKYYFERLEKHGDSLFFEVLENKKKIIQAARGYAAYHGFKIIARIEDSGVRVWRKDGARP